MISKKFYIAFLCLICLYFIRCKTENIVCKQRNIESVVIYNYNTVNKYNSYPNNWSNKKLKKISKRKVDGIKDFNIKYNISNKGFIKKIVFLHIKEKCVLIYKRDKNNLIRYYESKYNLGIRQFDIFSREYLYNETYFIEIISRQNDSIKWADSLIFNIDTNFFCYYPHFLICAQEPEFYMSSNYINHPIISCHFIGCDSIFYLYENILDSFNFVKKVKEKCYKIDNRDTILIDSTVFKIFYEE